MLQKKEKLKLFKINDTFKSQTILTRLVALVDFNKIYQI